MIVLSDFITKVWPNYFILHCYLSDGDTHCSLDCDQLLQEQGSTLVYVISPVNVGLKIWTTFRFALHPNKLIVFVFLFQVKDDPIFKYCLLFLECLSDFLKMQYRKQTS